MHGVAGLSPHIMAAPLATPLAPLAPLAIVLAVATVVRMLLWAGGWGPWVESRIEVSTPANSYQTLLEGSFLLNHGLMPYSGDNLHQSPLLVALASVTAGWGDWSHVMSRCVYCIIDLATGVLLYNAAALHYASLSASAATPQNTRRLQTLAVAAAALYLLCPFTVLACVGRSAATINNAAILLGLNGALRGNLAMSTFGTALATSLSAYPVLLLVPVALLHARPSRADKGWMVGAGAVVGFYALWLTGLGYMSRLFAHDWSFVDAVYRFTLAMDDLTPNIGLYWYYFLEIFDHFRDFFLCVFNLSVLACATPVIIRLRSEPVMLFTVLVFVMSSLKTYPSVGDVTLCLAFVPLWAHLLPYTRFTFVVANVFVFCTVLTPIMWHLWIYAGSGNANFFFALTIVINAALIFLAVDLLQAHGRNRYDVKHGLLVTDQSSDVILR